jgi:hypothetical protein
MPPLPRLPVPLDDCVPGSETIIANWARNYAEQYRKAWVASLKPVAWVDNDGFLDHAKDVNTENALNWGWIPLYRLDDQP